MQVYVYEAVTAGDLGIDVPPSLRREGAAMLNAVVADFGRVPGVSVKKGTQPAEKGPNTFFALVIAPEFNDLLRSRTQAVLDAGGRLLGSSPAAIRLTGDKLETARFWRERGVPHPRTDSEFARMAPWVLKPRHGAGSQATYLICDRANHDWVWQRARKEWPGNDFIEQEYVRGIDASVALLISSTQTIPLLPARQLVSIAGQFCYLGGSLPLPDPLASRAVTLALQAVAGITGLQGYVGVDLILGDDGHDYAIEVNPRLTTSYLGLRQLCRQNLAELILRMAQGETISPPTWNDGVVHFSAVAEA